MLLWHIFTDREHLPVLQQPSHTKAKRTKRKGQQWAPKNCSGRSKWRHQRVRGVHLAITLPRYQSEGIWWQTHSTETPSPQPTVPGGLLLIFLYQTVQDALGCVFVLTVTGQCSSVGMTMTYSILRGGRIIVVDQQINKDTAIKMQLWKCWSCDNATNESSNSEENARNTTFWASTLCGKLN